MSNVEVTGLGALNMDYLYRVDSILGDGETIAYALGHSEAEQKFLGSFPGGSAANTIYGLAKLGIRTGFIGIIGDDADGRKMLEEFREFGVDTGQIRIKPEAKTGLARCFIDKLNHRFIQVTPGANSLLTINDIDIDYVNQAEILHISSFADDRQFEMLLKLMKKLSPSVKISLSPGELYATKGAEILAPLLARTYVLFANEKEIEQLTGKDLKTGAEFCLKLGCHIVVVTLGKGTILNNTAAASYIRDTDDNEYIVRSSDKNEVSSPETTGAGDAFAAGFLCGLLKGRALHECGRLGDIIARFSISKTGARQGLPTHDELSQHCRELNITV
jgi:ribokinase